MTELLIFCEDRVPAALLTLTFHDVLAQSQISHIENIPGFELRFPTFTHLQTSSADV